MKEKIEETREKTRAWWSKNKDKVLKLGLAGGLLYSLGYIHASNKVLNKDKVYMTTQDGDSSDVSFIDI